MTSYNERESMYTNFETVYGEELYHHGVKGQKWGVRRYQNADGSLTPEGRSRYVVKDKLSRDGKSYVNLAGRLKLGKEGMQKYNEYNNRINQERNDGLKELENDFNKFNNGDKSSGDKILKLLDKRDKLFDEVFNEVAKETSINDKNHSYYLDDKMFKKVGAKLDTYGEKAGDKIEDLAISKIGYWHDYDNSNSFKSEKLKRIADNLRNLTKRINSFDYKKDHDKIVRLGSEYNKELSNYYGQVLKEMGFHDTEFNRKVIAKIEEVYS